MPRQYHGMHCQVVPQYMHFQYHSRDRQYHRTQQHHTLGQCRTSHSALVGRGGREEREGGAEWGIGMGHWGNGALECGTVPHGTWSLGTETWRRWLPGTAIRTRLVPGLRSMIRAGRDYGTHELGTRQLVAIA
eukprot:3941387-Rhodomonas_salina.3